MSRDLSAGELRSAMLWMQPDELFDDSEKPSAGPCPLLQAIEANASNEAVLARARRVADPRLLQIGADRPQGIIDDIDNQIRVRRCEARRNRDWEHRAQRSRMYRDRLRRKLLQMAEKEE